MDFTVGEGSDYCRQRVLGTRRSWTAKRPQAVWNPKPSSEDGRRLGLEPGRPAENDTPSIHDRDMMLGFFVSMGWILASGSFLISF